MHILGKFLIFFGFIVIAIGVMLMFYDKIPFIGKLPGDINIKKDNFQLYFPLTTSILLSLVLSLILWLISFFNNK